MKLTIRLAALTLAFRGDPKLSKARNGFPSPSAATVLASALTGLVTGVFCCLLPLAGTISVSGTAIGKSGVSSASVIAMLLVQFAILSTVFIRSRKKRGAPARAFFLYAFTVVAACALIAFVPPVCMLFGDTVPHPVMIAFAALPALLVFPVSRIMRYLSSLKRR